MRHASIIICSVFLALLGCNNAVESSGNAERQPDAQSQQSGSSPPALWSAAFKSQTLNECIQRATADGNTQGVIRCKCVVEKASTTIPEEKFKTVGSDAEVKLMIKRIGRTC